MANNTNICIIGGHLSKDSNLCKSEGKKSVLFFTVGNNHMGSVSYPEFKVFGAYAEALADVLKKGKEVTVEGYFKTEKKQTKNGDTYNAPVFIVKTVTLNGPKTKAEEVAEEVVEKTLEEQTEVEDLSDLAN